MKAKITIHVSTNFWSWYSIYVSCVASDAIFEVAPLWDFVKGEVAASGIAEAGALTVMHRRRRELINDVVATRVREVVETDVWTNIKWHF